MTGLKMNASAMKILAISAVCGLVGACGAPFAAKTDPQSPLTERIQGLVDANREYPRWADFPSAPTDVPDAGVIAAQVAGLDQTGEALNRSAAAIDWTLNDDPEAYASEIRRRVEGARMSVDTARTAAEVEAFARSLRERSEPPPPIDPR
ncbi:MAG: hypothetical protein ACI8U3_001192 [Brevundimonas sp.]|jgi:hypothetical protein|uniref:hypothetical protein n=1 Tax=Brevundimonas sp. TaxID=1871086 RepID=UPI0039E5F635